MTVASARGVEGRVRMSLPGQGNPKKIKDLINTKTQRTVAAVIGVIIVAAIVLGYAANSFLLLSIAAGSIGGIIHDLIQNKGLIVYPTSTVEGVYLGLGLGALLGAVSGFISFAAMATPASIDPKSLVIPLTWGLGLKGLVDGATNAATSGLDAKQ